MLSRLQRWPIRMLLVLVAAAFLFFARLGERAFQSDETRWAEIPREMRLNDDYLHPTINGKTYYDKPLLSYWLVLASSWVTGALDETSVRLPSALAGLLGVGLLMVIARRLYDNDTSIMAGVILATSFGFVNWSRHASADIETVTGVLAALWLFLRNEQNPTGWWTLGLWLIMALTSLTKGLLGFALPIVVIVIYSALTATSDENHNVFLRLIRRNRWLLHPQSLIAIPLGIAVYLAPFLLSSLATGSTEGMEMVWRENIRRFYDPVNHRGPVYLYLYVIFLLLAPWAALLPAAMVQAHTDGSRHRFALVYFWATLAFFTLSASRRSYYLLPILPAGALLLASLLTTRHEKLYRFAYRLLQVGCVLIVMSVVASISMLFLLVRLLPEPWNALPRLPHGWVFVVAWHASLIGICLAAIRFRPERIACSLTITACAFMIYAFLFFLTNDIYRTQKPFAEAVKAELGSRVQDVALFKYREIVFYLGQDHPLAEYHTVEELTQAIRERKVRWIIARRRDWQDLDMPTTVVLAETVHPWEGREQRSAKLMLVEVGQPE